VLVVQKGRSGLDVLKRSHPRGLLYLRSALGGEGFLGRVLLKKKVNPKDTSERDRFLPSKAETKKESGGKL